MIKVYDNFLPFFEADKISFILSSPNISWKISDVVSGFLFDSNENKKYNFQMIHKFLDAKTDGETMINKDTYSLIKPLVDKINAEQWFRIKMNLNPATEQIIEHGMHIDNQSNRDDAYTAIYYLNTNNGYTLFENGAKIESVFNRLVVFPANIKHTGTTCTDANTRFVINFNFYRDNIDY